MKRKEVKTTGELGELKIEKPTHPHLTAAEQAVRALAGEQGGKINPREAHDAWRWKLTSNGWGAGAQLDVNAKTHPLLVAFELLPVGELGHALAYLEDDNAEQDPGAGSLDQSTEGITR